MNFYKLWEAIQHQEEKNGNLDIILEKLTKEDCVKFALYCAEDVLHLNNENTLPYAQNCINLVKRWLNDPKDVSENELRTASTAAANSNDAVFNDDVIRAAVNAAADAAWTAWTATRVDNVFEPSYWAESTANYAAQASPSNRNKYINLARSLLSTTTSKNPMHKTFIQEPDIGSIAAFLDHAEEIGEDIVLNNKDEFIFNMPGHMIRAKDKGELAEKILKDRWAMDYLKRLYK